jgi:hypothetical protein
MSVRLAQSSFKAARSPVFSPLYNALMTTSEAAGGSATTDVMLMLRAAGKKAFFPSTNPATGWWQDSAGTTQAALEQPVGRITDLSGNNYHATQANSLNRPLYTQRVNYCQRTESLENAAWTATGLASRAAGSTATLPNGQSVQLTTLTEDTSTGFHRCFLTAFNIPAANAELTVSVVLKAGSRGWGWIRCDDSIATRYVYVNLTTGALGTVAAGVTASTPVALGSSAWLLTVRYTTTTGLSCNLLVGATSADNTPTYTGNGSTIEAGAVDMRLSAFSAMNLPAYQRVGNGTAGVADYDTAGFRPMLYFDGTSDALATSAIDLTGTDQIMALANVLKVSDAAQGMVYETTASSAANNGSMFISAPAAASATFSAGSRGTALATATSAASYAAPNLACLRFDADVSSDSVALLRQAASIATSATDQGTGNYSSAALYIGARTGTSLWFKGYMIPGPLLDTTGIPAALLDSMAREQAALWGVAI